MYGLRNVALMRMFPNGMGGVTGGLDGWVIAVFGIGGFGSWECLWDMGACMSAVLCEW